jgi:hypothetical protein
MKKLTVTKAKREAIAVKVLPAVIAAHSLNMGPIWNSKEFIINETLIITDLLIHELNKPK